MKSDVISVGEPIPRIAAVVPLEGRKVKVMWKTGETKVVDLAPVLASRRVFIPLREDDELFRGVRVGEYGSCIEWDGDLDISALGIEHLPEAQFTNVEFRNAMDQLGMSLDGMAAGLEISRRLVAEYRKDKPIPRHIALATRYLLGRVDQRSGPLPPRP